MLAGAQSGQEQLEEMETAAVSPACSGKRFWGLEEGAGWAADGWSQVRSTSVEGHGFARMAPCCSTKEWKVVRWDCEARSRGKMGQD